MFSDGIIAGAVLTRIGNVKRSASPDPEGMLPEREK